MGQIEIIEFSNSDSVASLAMQPVIVELLAENPGLEYSRVNYDEEPDLVRALISSRPPTISPFFVGFLDGKAVASVTGIVSKEDLKNITI